MKNTIALTTLKSIFEQNKDIWLKNVMLKDKLTQELAKELSIEWNKIDISQAHIRQLIKELRQNGCLIIASNMGYKLTTNQSEIQHYLKSRWGELTREMKILKTISIKCDCIDMIPLWESESKNEKLKNKI